MADSSSSEGEQKAANGCRSDSRRFGLTREDRIRGSSEFRRITREGDRYRTRNFLILTLKNQAGRSRLGLTVGKKVGNACVRNRVKRRLREYFRLNRDKMPPETDVVFIAHKGAASLDMHQLHGELDRFFQAKFCICPGARSSG